MKHGQKMIILLLIIVTVPAFAQIYPEQWSVGVFGGAKKLVGQNLMNGDMVAPWFGASVGYTPEPRLTYTLSGGYGMAYPLDGAKSGFGKHFAKYPDTPYETTLIPVFGNVRVNLNPESRINPYLEWGIGLLFWNLKADGTSVHDAKMNALGNFGLGLQIFLFEALSFDVSGWYHHLIHQDLDMSGMGDIETGALEGRIGLTLHLGGNKDTDGDGVPDRDDADPKNPEDFDSFQDEDGAPDPDNDGDGIMDASDKAPNQPEDKDGFQDEDGVPDPDNDGDGILDVNDKAPNEAEDMDGFQDDDGVPDPDNDGDGILDGDDKAPNEPETFNGFEDEDGAPDTKPEVVIEMAAPIVLDGVTFLTGSATISEGAKTVLDRVVRTLVDYPEMVVEVRGHTDNVGRHASNITLSQQRANSVKTYLESQGIEPEKIEARGFGPDNPIDTNDTPEGRSNNRRIEFIRLK